MEIDINKINLGSIHNSTYNSFCKKSKSIQTFQLSLYPNQVAQFYSQKPSNEEVKSLNGDNFDYKKHFNYTQHYKGVCKCCNTYSEDYLLNFLSAVPMDRNNYSKGIKYYLRKIGQFPAFKLAEKNEIKGFLKEEDLAYYNKAKMNLNSGYSIGAYAYFRRIIESQIIAICESVVNIQNQESKKMRTIIDNYYTHHQMSKLIDDSYKYFPASLKELGDNPLKLLHSQLSIGIHTLTEDECFNKSIAIDDLLTFVIRKLNEENVYKKGAIDAIKKLS